jgi:hypothetical protein
VSDRDRFEVEMSPAMQPSGGAGDRILVGLALIALLGGLAIVAAKVLPNPESIAQASAAPSGSPIGTQRPAPTPAPARVLTVIEPGSSPGPVNQPVTFSGWVRAKADLVIRATPGLDGADIGVFARGEAAQADQQDQPADEPGWMFLQHRLVVGWIATIEGGRQLVDRYGYETYVASGYLFSLAAGPEGFVALAAQPGDSDAYPPPAPVTSTDGAAWRKADPAEFGGADIVGIAHGPAGWLAVATVNGQTNAHVWLWNSPDGQHWTRLGEIDGLAGEYVVQFVASSHAYLIQTSGGRRDGAADTWVSNDSLIWREVVDPLLTGSLEGRRMVGLPDAFYLWNGYPGVGTGSPEAAFSLDGERWTAVPQGGPGGPGLLLAGLGDRILAIETDAQSLVARVWFASIVGDGVIWSRQTDAETAFAGAVVTQLVSHDGRAYAFGWDRSTAEPLVWAGDGIHWLRTPLPAAFGGLPQVAAAGAAGVVVLGHRPTSRGDNPIFWHRTPAGAWLAEDQAVIELVPDPAADACKPLPDDILAFSFLDRAAATVCFGDAPITFRAWSLNCDECYGTGPGVSQPAWLLSPTSNQLFLSAVESSTDWLTNVVLSPALHTGPSWTGTWLDLTGHFNDPAATTCRYEPTIDDLAYWGGPQTIVDQCRQTFVVTDVTVVPG